MNVYRWGVISSLILGVIFAFFSYSLMDISKDAAGPGLWPLTLCIIIIIASILSLIFEKDSSHFEGFTMDSRFTIYALVSLMVFIALFEWIGFIIPSFLLLMFWFKYLGKESWKLSISTSVLITSGFYYLFVYVLKVPFPEGLIF